jgi:hypothetical protein
MYQGRSLQQGLFKMAEVVNLKLDSRSRQHRQAANPKETEPPVLSGQSVNSNHQRRLGVTPQPDGKNPAPYGLGFCSKHPSALPGQHQDHGKCQTQAAGR